MYYSLEETMNKKEITAKSLAETGYYTVDSLIKKGRYPENKAHIIVFKGRKYVNEDDTILQLDAQGWLEYDQFPKTGEQPNAEGRFLINQTEPVASKTEWARQGRKISKNAKSVAIKTYYKQYRGHIKYEVFRKSETLQTRKKSEPTPGKNLGLERILEAIFAINRAAKRRRDAASSNYEKGNHGFARYQSDEKDSLYTKKEKGILIAISLGLLKFNGLHGNMAVWNGGGYSFHSSLAPKGTTFNEEQDYHISEAHPKRTNELRLVDAKATIDALTAPTAEELNLITVEIPRFKKPLKSFLNTINEEWDDEDEEYEYEQH